MKNRKTFWRLVAALLLAVGAVAIYTAYDNQRFIVVEQEVTVAGLPEAFDGFRILQISDLHGRSFGDHQADLARAINALEYDLIAFTGDMNPSTAGNSVEDARALFDLLERIEQKERVFWVDGNTGPYARVSETGLPTGMLTETGEALRSKGVHILQLPVALELEGARIWIVPEMYEGGLKQMEFILADETQKASLTDPEAFQAYALESRAAFDAINGNDEVKILLRHEPMQVDLTEDEIIAFGHLDYDLILAGHYHGGQIRLPLVGALYIPSPTTGINNSGFLPEQIAVKGVSYFGKTPQYVSAGLGASGHNALVGFRLFNTPEINVVVLRGE